MAADYAEILAGGNRVGLHYSRSTHWSTRRARAITTIYAEKIFAP